MALREYQFVLEVGKLYHVRQRAAVSGVGDQLNPNIWVSNDSIDLYTSNSGEEPQSLSDMTLGKNDKSVFSIKRFHVIPRFIAAIAGGNTPLEIIISGLNLELIGDIS